MKKLNLFLIGLFLTTSGLFAQTLDRISMSAGGASGDDVNFVLGETFNFAMAKDGEISLETGSLASEQNTGADNNFTKVETLYKLKQTNCYPNPTSGELSLDLTGFQNLSGLSLSIYNLQGKLIEKKASKNGSYNASSLSQGGYFISISKQSGEIIGVAKFVKE